MHRYDLIAIDLDGTLLCSAGQVSDANVHAIERARDAGVHVVICTGRGLKECERITERIGALEPIIVAGGAVVACPRSRETMHRFTMCPQLTGEIVDRMVDGGHAAVLLKDSEDAEHDYLVVSKRGIDGLDGVTRWWFEHHDVPVRFVASLDDDEYPEHTVRIGICGPRRRTTPTADVIGTQFGHRLTLHHFGAVVPHAESDDPEDQIVILEAFDATANKWSAVRWLSDRVGCDEARVASIGNDVNDVVMLASSALGVAMGNAIPEATAAADRTTRRHDEDGVAHAIDRILDGDW